MTMNMLFIPAMEIFIKFFFSECKAFCKCNKTFTKTLKKIFFVQIVAVVYNL